MQQVVRFERRNYLLLIFIYLSSNMIRTLKYKVVQIYQDTISRNPL